jgi:hypothetical protein
MRSPSRLLLPLLLLPAIAAAQDEAARRPALQDCAVLEREGPDGPASIGLALTGDGPERHVVAAQPRGTPTPVPALDLRPLRPGISYGATLAGGEASFTLATLEPAGTVLLETWRWRDSPPAHAWARLRCGP